MSRGRPRKAKLDQVVFIPGQGYGVVVDYLPKRAGARYVVVRTDAIGRQPRGQRLLLDSGEFEPQFYVNGLPLISRTPGVVYRGNRKLDVVWGERPCDCQCCIH